MVRGYLAVQAAAVALTFLFAGGGLYFPVPQLLGSQLLGLLATLAAMVVSVRLGRRGPGGAGRRALTVLANAALGLFAFDAKGKPLGDVYLVDQDGNPVVATDNGNEYLEQPDLVDGDGNEVANRYPRAQHQFDPDSGQSTPVTAPQFRPPPGPVGP